MGKDWLFWGGGGGGGGTTSVSSNNRSINKRRRSQGNRGRDTPPPPGCMNAVFQLFDLQQFHLAFHHQPPSFKPDSFLPEEPIKIKGVEAPRNSLELEEPPVGAAILSSVMAENDNLNIPGTMGMQIKTSGDGGCGRRSKSRTDDLSSECSSSPRAKTPSLVARLMGLDLLPECSSPSSSSSFSTHLHLDPQLKSHLHPHVQSLKDEFQSRKLLQSRSNVSNRNFDTMGTMSLPETPRISSARMSDVDNHRLSLQSNKENGVATSEELNRAAFLNTKMRRRRELRQEDENRSPRHYARQIVKQVKDSVSRRAGADITNTIRTREEASEEPVVLLKAKKPSNSESKQSTPSCSPRLRFLELKNKPNIVTTSPNKGEVSHSSKISSSRLSSNESVKVPTSRPKSPLVPVREQKCSAQKCKKIVSERSSQRPKKPPQTSDLIRNKVEEPFARSSMTARSGHSDKKCKRTPLSNDLINISVPTLLSVKKEYPSPAKSFPPKQEYSQVVSDALPPKSSRRSTLSSSSSSLPSCSSSSLYKQEATHPLAIQDISNTNHITTTVDDAAEFHHYISAILKRTGIGGNTPVSFTKWYSPAHPLDPSIFHQIELAQTLTTTATDKTKSKLSQMCNRRLVFHLVDDLLVEILRPHINLKPWITPGLAARDSQMRGSQLIDALCGRIRSFPVADCRVLEDIDALIDKDLGEKQAGKSWIEESAYEEEGEGVVTEIEREVLETLVHETAMVVRQLSLRNTDCNRGGAGARGVGGSDLNESDGRHMGHSRDEMLFVGF